MVSKKDKDERIYPKKTEKETVCGHRACE